MAENDWITMVGARPLGPRLVAARKRKHPTHGPPSAVEHFEFPFQRWDGPIGDWVEHFGKGSGQVRSLDGATPLRSCNEVEVAKRLRGIRERAFWFSQYNVQRVPDIWRPWVRSLKTDAPKWLTSLNQVIRGGIASRWGGMPDVVAWNECQGLQSALFVECKAHAEAFSESQEDWVWAARAAGVELSQIGVSLRPF